jgi:acyl-[acyl-carrier-protein]-phospholipid O-acyltransferase/long-chain-fatty-acid--[acyl-carrier-protein] ligase
MSQGVASPSMGTEQPFGRITIGTKQVDLPEPGKEPWRKSLFAALCDSRAKFGGKTVVYNDFAKTALTYDRLTLGAILLGDKLRDLGRPDAPLGILLPNASGVAAVFFACQAVGRVPAMLNYSSGLRSLNAACDAAEITVIVSSRAFIEKAGLQDLVEGLAKRCQFVWTEDLRAQIGTFDKIKGMARLKFGLTKVPGYHTSPDALAVIVFTSGTEGVPKGVALTHANLLSNCWQFDNVIDLHPGDTFFTALPVFHTFGLTAGLIAGVVLGVGAYFYPSPLHYKEIPEHIRRSGAKIVVSTDTFVNGWIKSAEPDDFKNVRLVVLGAERVREQTRKLFKDKFDIELLEGYGVTETAPVLAANHEDDNMPGTVGYMMPAIEHKVEPVPGLSEGGRLMVRGPNVMAGYIKVDAPGVVQPLADGWHDTGDIVDIDEKGRISIKGRAKRFAKLGGEMVSLSAVEAYVSQVWPDASHAVVAVPDPRKGETLVLVTEKDDPDLQEVRAWAKENGVAELMLPRKVVSVEELPVLGTGKLNYGALDELANPAQSEDAAA